MKVYFETVSFCSEPFVHCIVKKFREHSQYRNWPVALQAVFIIFKTRECLSNSILIEEYPYFWRIMYNVGQDVANYVWYVFYR